MQTIFPTETGASGMYIVGFRKNPIGGVAQRVGTILVKRQYLISGSALIPQNDPVGIRLTDTIVDAIFDGKTYHLTDFESDVSVFKPKADLIVRGSYSTSNSYSASVKAPGGSEHIWLQRSVPTAVSPITDADAARNMFGWEQRWFDARKALANVPPFTPPATAPDYSLFSNGFFNAYRRVFAKSGFPAERFSPGSTITLKRTPDGSSSSTVVSSFVLRGESISGKLFFHHKGHIDKKINWCSRNIEDIKLDTVVVTPAENAVYAIWRGLWDFDSYSPESYRMLSVKLQEAA